jgi:hypothetical protein
LTNKATAQFSGGNGTENNPYIITTAQQLAQLATFVNAGNEAYYDKHYKLGNDIDLSAYQSGMGWTPIGTNNNGFYGSFDGDGKKIIGLYINAPDIDRLGLFSYVSEGSIKNLGIENVNITGREYVGGIASGLYDSGSITNCYVTGNITGTYGASGIVSTVNTTCNISNCYSGCNISGNTYAGGVVGNIYGGSKITNCYSTGDISGTYRVGGIAAAVFGYATIKNCYATGKINGTEQVGGIVGSVYDNGSVSYCVALNPSVKAATYYVGRVAGSKNASLSNNAAWNGILNSDGNVFWDHTGASELDGEDMTTQTIQSDGTLGGRFTAANGWTTQNGKLPGLFGKPVEMPAHLGGSAGIVETWRAASLQVYPNPTAGELKIESGELSIARVVVFDIYGREQKAESRKDKATGIIMDISELPSGVYFVKICTETGEVVRKVVKE